MVRIFADTKGSGDFVIQTTALDVDTFLYEFAEAFDSAVVKANDNGVSALGILKNAMPIAYKLSGYKADTVQEQRTLVCGTVSPNSCEVVSSAGR